MTVNYKNIKKRLSLLVVIGLSMGMLFPTFAGATNLTQASVSLGRLGNGASTNNSALVTFKLNTTPTSVADILLTFPSGFTLTAGTVTPTTTGFPATPASITPTPGTLSATITSSGPASGGTILVSGLTSASLTSTTLYGFNIPTGYITNPSTAGQYTLSLQSETTTPTVIDTTYVPVYIYGASANQDQVSVTASVSPNFNFALSSNSDTIPAVDPTTIQTSSGVNMTVGTNSPLGYTAYVRSANGALVSAVNPGTPINTGTFSLTTPNTLTPGTTNYTFVPSTGTACTICTGTLTYNGGYTVTNSTQGGAFNGTNFAAFVSRNGYTNADTVKLQERIAVANTVGYSNDYTDTLTVVAAGNF